MTIPMGRAMRHKNTRHPPELGAVLAIVRRSLGTRGWRANSPSCEPG